MTRCCTCIAAVKTSPRQSLGSRRASWMLVTGCLQQAQTERRQDWSALDLVKTQHISTPWSWSIFTTGHWYCTSLRPYAVAWSNYLGWSEPGPPSVRHPTGYDTFDKFANHSTTNRQPYWFTPSLRPGSTIAICCWPEHQSLLPTSCSGSWTLQCELWAYLIVRLWLNTPASFWATLARCGRSSSFVFVTIVTFALLHEPSV